VIAGGHVGEQSTSRDKLKGGGARFRGLANGGRIGSFRTSFNVVLGEGVREKGEG
jgi:hypothetical protein